MRLTYAFSESGLPVFVDGKGDFVPYREGFKALMKKRGFSAADLAQICGVSVFTVYGWRMGRRPGPAARV